MTQAVVCLPSHADVIVAEILFVLDKLKPKTFRSVDDCFEYLWSEGRNVGMFIFELDDEHIEELRTCAHHWIEMRIIAFYNGDKIPSKSMDSIFVISNDQLANEFTRVIKAYLPPDL